jgi:spermidine synthase
MIRTPILFLHVLVIATCGLIYELLAGTVASYVLGDSVTQFSLVIGLYLSALGVGAWLSRHLDGDLPRYFVEVELGVALVGGGSAPILFFAFAHAAWFHVVLYVVVFAIGVLVGLELPLLMRIVKDQLSFKDLVAQILSFDYAGALVASLVFPLLLVPRLGLARTSLVVGLANALIALWASHLFAPLIPRGLRGLRVRAAVVLVILTLGLARADWLTTLAEDQLFSDEVVYARTTPYQRIVVTRGRAGFQLFLNGNLQFASADEYRYHEALVHPALSLPAAPRRVLVLGGGDGLALREILRYPSVERVVLVDLDPGMTGLSDQFPPLKSLNRASFADRRVQVVNEDAMIWLGQSDESFDVAIVDFPDPNSFSLGKLYTTRFYRQLRARLAPDAAVAVQTTSPLFARRSFWCVTRTLEAAGFAVHPYHVTVPSFGEWGFALARLQPFDPPQRLRAGGLQFLTEAVLPSLFVFAADMGPLPVEVNRLDNQTLVRYYEAEWRRWE